MTESPDERARQRLPRPRGAPDDADAGADPAGVVPDGPWSPSIPAPRSPADDRVPRSTTPDGRPTATPTAATSGTPSATVPSAALVVAPDRLPARRPVPAGQRWRRAADGLAQAALLVAGAVADAVLAVGSLVARLLPARPAAAGG